MFVYLEEANFDQMSHSNIKLLLQNLQVSGNTKMSKGVLVFPSFLHTL